MKTVNFIMIVLISAALITSCGQKKPKTKPVNLFEQDTVYLISKFAGVQAPARLHYTVENNSLVSGKAHYDNGATMLFDVARMPQFEGRGVEYKGTFTYIHGDDTLITNAYIERAYYAPSAKMKIFNKDGMFPHSRFEVNDGGVESSIGLVLSTDPNHKIYTSYGFAVKNEIDQWIDNLRQETVYGTKYITVSREANEIEIAIGHMGQTASQTEKIKINFSNGEVQFHESYDHFNGRLIEFKDGKFHIELGKEYLPSDMFLTRFTTLGIEFHK